jgi:hypothetical protein
MGCVCVSVCVWEVGVRVKNVIRRDGQPPKNQPKHKMTKNLWLGFLASWLLDKLSFFLASEKGQTVLTVFIFLIQSYNS